MMINTFEDAILQLTEALSVQSLSDLDAPWQHRIDDTWTIAVNGLSHVATVAPKGCMSIELQPYYLAVWFNGLLAALWHPLAGGEFVAYMAANRTAFFEAVTQHIEALKEVA